jgi:outer membrane protein assembly factor BamB
MDTGSGSPVWEADSGEKVAALKGVKEQFIREKKKPLDAGGGPWSTKHRDIGTCFDNSVLIAAGVVVVSDSFRESKFDGYGMVGFDGRDGTERWRVPGCVGSYVSPVKWIHQGEEYAIGASRKKAVCVDPKTGRVLWKIEAEAVHVAGGTPAVWGDYLVLCARARKQTKKVAAATAEADGFVCYRLGPQGAEKVWSFKGKDGSHGDSSVIIHRGHLYTTLRGKYSCINIASGEIVATLEGRGASGYAPIAANGKIFSASSPIGYINADPKDFRALTANRDMRPGSYVHPVYAGGRLYYRGAHHLYCWDLRK